MSSIPTTNMSTLLAVICKYLYFGEFPIEMTKCTRTLSVPVKNLQSKMSNYPQYCG